MENHTILTHYGPWHNSGWLAKGVNAPSHRAQCSGVGAKGEQEGGYFGRQEATIETIQVAPTPVTEEGRGSILFAGRCWKRGLKGRRGVCGEWGAEAESKASQNNNGGSDSAAASSAADNRLSFVCLQINWVGWSVVRWSTQSHEQSFYFLSPQNLSKQW